MEVDRGGMIVNSEDESSGLEARLRAVEEGLRTEQQLAASRDRDLSEVQQAQRSFLKALNGQRQDFVDLRRDVGDLRTDLTDLRGDVQELRSEMRRGFATVNAGMGAVVDLLERTDRG